jgi:D-sedoheptulose 7-phosphate isomerase
MSASFSASYLEEARAILAALDDDAIERMANALAAVRARGGRLFIVGVGGSAGHASHAVNDFRKICDIEAYAPTDNVAELTARTNDDGWESVFSEWLIGSRLGSADAILVFSVGGGDAGAGVSPNLVRAIDLAVERGASVFGVVGREGGHTAARADECVVIPPMFPERTTPHTEGLCAVVWHLLVSHPALQRRPTTWERIAEPR